MHQLEETLNVCLCGYLLISLATMCFTSFSVVTVQYKNIGTRIIRSNNFVNYETVLYGRCEPTCSLHS